MGLTIGASRSEQAGGVTLAQLIDVAERAAEEATRQGIATDTVEPKVRVTMGGKIRAIEIQV